MLKRLLAHFPNFPVRLNDTTIDGKLYSRVWRPIDESWATATHHESRGGIYLARPFVLRAINNYAGRARTWPRHFPYLIQDNFVAYDRHAEALGEMVHISALSRYGQSVIIGGSTSTYRPENLRRVLPYIAATYGLAQSIDLRRPIAVVDWDGNPLDPTHPQSKDRIGSVFSHGTIARIDLDQRVADLVAHTPKLTE